MMARAKLFITNLFRGAVSNITKLISDANGLIDLTTGQTKSGATIMVEGLMARIGESLCSSIFPIVADSFQDKDANQQFLDGKFTDNVLLKDLKAVKERSAQVPDFFSGYKKASNEGVGEIISQLENYKNAINSIVETHKFRRWKDRKTFDEIHKIRKEMKRSLKNVQEIIKKYKFCELYTNKAMIESVIKETHNITDDVLDAAKQVPARVLPQANATADDKVKAIADPLRRTVAQKLLDEAQALIKKLPKKNGTQPNSVDPNDVDEKTLEEPQKAEFANARDIIANPGEKAREVFSAVDIGSIEVNKARVKIVGTLVGDFMDKLKKSVKYTLDEIDNVIKLGSKNRPKAPNADTDKQGINIDIKKLSGVSGYDSTFKTIEQKQANMNDRIAASLLNSVKKAHSNIEKEYKAIDKKIQKINNTRYSEDETDKPKVLQYKVILPHSAKDDQDTETTKEYDIKKRYEGGKVDSRGEEIQGLKSMYPIAVAHISDNPGLAALYLRKAEKFLRACKQWNKDFKEYQEKEKQDLKNLNKSIDMLFDQVKKYSKDKNKTKMPNGQKWPKTKLGARKLGPRYVEQANEFLNGVAQRP